MPKLNNSMYFASIIYKNSKTFNVSIDKNRTLNLFVLMYYKLLRHLSDNLDKCSLPFLIILFRKGNDC